MDFVQGRISVVHREIGQVNVHGQTGEIPYEEVDCGTSLQRKHVFGLSRQNPEKQLRLFEEDRVLHHVPCSKSRGTVIRYFLSNLPFGTPLKASS